MEQSLPSSSSSFLQKTASTPIFHNDINKAYTEEWQKIIETSKDAKNSKIFPFFLNLQTSFDTISKLCHQWSLSIETEFIALDCLETMIELFLNDLTEAINEESNGDSEKIHSYWTESYNVFKMDVPLIIFLIVNIAAKYIDTNTCFNLKKVQELMQVVTGKEYKMSEVKEHEFYLFKTMKSKVSNPVALHSLEQMMKQIYDQDVLKIKQGEFLKTGVLMLRFAYLEKHRIYQSLEKGIKDRIKFKKFTADKVLLAVAVVYATSNIINAPKSWISQIHKQLSDTCLYDERDIVTLGKAITMAFLD